MFWLVNILHYIIKFCFLNLFIILFPEERKSNYKRLMEPHPGKKYSPPLPRWGPGTLGSLGWGWFEASPQRALSRSPEEEALSHSLWLGLQCKEGPTAGAEVLGCSRSAKSWPSFQVPLPSPSLHNEHNNCGRAVTACCVISRSKWWPIPSLTRNVQGKITQIRLLLWH